MSAADEIRARLPKLAARTSGSKAAAIKAFCIECVGGSSHEAGRCDVMDCWLWPHAFRKQRQPVPRGTATHVAPVPETAQRAAVKKRRVVD